MLQSVLLYGYHLGILKDLEEKVCTLFFNILPWIKGKMKVF